MIFNDHNVSDNCEYWFKQYKIIIIKDYSGNYRLRFTNAKRNDRYKKKSLHVVMWEKYWGVDIEKGFVVHHIDANTLNNEIYNLHCIPASLHISLHHKGKKLSDETKEKLSNSLKGDRNPKYWLGKHRSKGTKIKISNSHKGKKHSQETKDRLSELTRGSNNPMFGVRRFGNDNPMFGKRGDECPHFGNTHSDETKQKMSEKRKLYWQRRREQIQKTSAIS